MLAASDPASGVGVTTAASDPASGVGVTTAASAPASFSAVRVCVRHPATAVDASAAPKISVRERATARLAGAERGLESPQKGQAGSLDRM